VLIVESDEDQCIVDPHLDFTVARTLPSHGKLAAIAAAQLISTSPNLPPIACLIDGDFDAILGTDTYPSGCYPTNYYDLLVEVVVLAPNLLRRVALSAGISSQVLELERQLGVSLSDWLGARSATVGALRLHSQQAGLAIPLRNFPYNGLASVPTAQRFTDKVAAIGSLRSGSLYSTADLSQGIRQVLQTQASDSLMNGHDLLGLLVDLLRSNGISSATTRGILIAAASSISCGIFAQVGIYSNLATWIQSGTSVWSCPNHV